MSYPRDAEIYGEGEPAEFVYRVVSGAVRSVRLLADGRRQIGGFYRAGAIFGLEAGEDHRLSAEAIVDSEIAVIGRKALLALAQRDPELARDLWEITAADLGRAQDHMLLLCRKNAVERVATFLLQMAEPTAEGDAVNLPMSRYDIADYLGLTIETVSRTLAQLERDGAIELPSSRHILLRNPRALERLNA